MAKNDTHTTLIIVGAIILFFLMIWLFQQVWNWIVPEVFNGINKVSYRQAIGVLFLASVLFSPVVLCNSCNKNDK